MVSDIANRLARKGIPVNYLGIIEGTSLKSIKPNVKRAQNFICTGAECSKRRVGLAGGNSVTKLNQYTYDDGHIDLGNTKVFTVKSLVVFVNSRLHPNWTHYFSYLL